MPTDHILPELWGVGEIVEFANKQLEKEGRPPVSKASVSDWVRAGDFPQPAVRLKMGDIWFADLIKPWVLDRLARPGMRTGRPGNRIDEETRTAIAAHRYEGRRMEDVAAQFGVSRMTVARIWRQQ